MDVVLGAGTFGYKLTSGAACLSDKHLIQDILSEFKKHGYKNIDTARSYSQGTSEEILTELNYAQQGFSVDTKIYSSGAGSHKAENVAKSIRESLAALKTNKVRILFLHYPDRTTPFEETLEAINEAYKQGHFEKFGVSNYSAEEVEQIVRITREKGWIQPTVYQGLYNLVSRACEQELFPVLRKYGISFIAFSILAGSFLSGNITQNHEATPKSRFDTETPMGQEYRKHFFKESYFQAIEKLKEVAQEHDLSIAEIAIRWIVHHSILKPEFWDSIIVGGTKLHNVKNNLGSISLLSYLNSFTLYLKYAPFIFIWRTLKNDTKI
eukprot:Phypoly_transcript_12139.p1 GENE.Phypoly_transcript_12139~~Phypoly_transcript_12139.p1  ORF type:complete len:336 (-),score=27.70 Phypoly_transcript_12139:152-1123(-)